MGKNSIIATTTSPCVNNNNTATTRSTIIDTVTPVLYVQAGVY